MYYNNIMHYTHTYMYMHRRACPLPNVCIELIYNSSKQEHTLNTNELNMTQT